MIAILAKPNNVNPTYLAEVEKYLRDLGLTIVESPPKSVWKTSDILDVVFGRKLFFAIGNEPELRNGGFPTIGKGVFSTIANFILEYPDDANTLGLDGEPAAREADRKNSYHGKIQGVVDNLYGWEYSGCSFGAVDVHEAEHMVGHDSHEHLDWDYATETFYFEDNSIFKPPILTFYKQDEESPLILTNIHDIGVKDSGDWAAGAEICAHFFDEDDHRGSDGLHKYLVEFLKLSGVSPEVNSSLSSAALSVPATVPERSAAVSLGDSDRRLLLL